MQAQGDIGHGAKQGRRLFEGEKGLVLTGLLGFMLAALCGIWTLVNGGEISPGGDVSKAFSFNAALGIFLLSTAAIMPLSALGERSRLWFRRVYIGLALYAYGAETIQNFRGVNPRFVENGSAFDQAVGNIFGFVAMLLIVFYLYVGVQFFRARAYRLRPEMAIGIRYAMIAVTVSFAAGIWISVGQSRFTGAEGNIIWLHGLGFHALQAVPLVAWLAERTSANARARRAIVHIAGISYLLGLAAIGWLTIEGRTLLEWSPLPVAAGFCFLVSLAAGASALRRVLREMRTAGGEKRAVGV
ncbi:hypothetical protein ACFSR7_14745 [Cohnella sp. GCM10020058]|uniref:hypothetical protein n=1 Tax=Cohnella sp. GCM10020058 TaxID=3317330 RepID=UPI003626B5BA